MKLYLIISLFFVAQIVYCEKNKFLLLSHDGKTGAVIKHKTCLGNLEYQCDKKGGYTTLYLEKGCKKPLATERVCIAPHQCRCLKSLPKGYLAKIFRKDGKEEFMSFFLTKRICLGRFEINPHDDGISFSITFFNNKSCKDKKKKVKGEYGKTVELDSQTDILLQAIDNDLDDFDDDNSDLKIEEGDNISSLAIAITNMVNDKLSGGSTTSTIDLSTGFTSGVPFDLTSIFTDDIGTTNFAPIDFTSEFATGSFNIPFSFPSGDDEEDIEEDEFFDDSIDGEEEENNADDEGDEEEQDNVDDEDDNVDNEDDKEDDDGKNESTHNPAPGDGNIGGESSSYHIRSHLLEILIAVCITLAFLF